MTLAIILSTCVFLSAASSYAVGGHMQAAGQQASPAQPSGSTPAQSQDNSGNKQNPPASEPQTPPASANPAPAPASTPTPPTKNSAVSKRRHGKKPPATGAASDCAKSGPAGNAAPSGSEPAAKADAASEGKTAPPTNCPPKTVIHDGSTTESSIQLVGGTGTQKTADQRTTTDQLVGSTEENLKKIAGRQLDSNQQELLKQIEQFLNQSKAAIAAGDIERGHNLALKAHLLSDELAKP